VRASRDQIAIGSTLSSVNIAAMRYVMAGFLVIAIAAGPARAGDPTAAVDLWSSPNAWPPAESGKPIIGPQPLSLSPRPPETCRSGMPCSLRLLGDVRRNGAVELQVPALRW